MKLIGNLFVSLFKYKKIATILLLVTNIAYSILLKVGEVFTPHASFFEMMGALEVYRLLWSPVDSKISKNNQNVKTSMKIPKFF